MKTQAHVTRKKLEQDKECGTLTLKMEHGIRSHLSNVEYDVLDDLIQTAWVHLLSQPVENRTERLAYLYGKKAAERHWQRTKTLQKHIQDTSVEDEMPEPMPEDHSLSRAEGLAMHALSVLGEEQYNWLIKFISNTGFKTSADNNHAQSLLSALECGGS